MAIFLATMVITAQGLSIAFIYWIWKKKKKRGASARAQGRSGAATIKDGKVRVLATFTGLRGLPWIAFASNSLNPVFCIESQQLVFRVIRQHQRPFADIREVDVRTGYGTFNLIFSFRDTPLTFAANVETAARGAEALALLPNGVPLSDRTRSALQALQALQALPASPANG
ncbi:hypothetical protein [Variovorax sp. LT1R16]|uniref:hypothetical protein n=1 Tax=Variovorax sp. LT1R16 TaxID=3443728 RepID=UPI003F46FA27